ncbi:MAG: hypothetical protein HQ483_10875 [Rhodospirillales bacterium]|nr:hypothetical protein [Rhodospirillales bacterium]
MVKNTIHLRSAFRNARYLLLPFFLGPESRQASSVMNGFLPCTEEWFHLYPHTKEDHPNDIWERFFRRHAVAVERAKTLRNILGNEALEIHDDDGVIPVSLLRPDIRISGCVGRSMAGANIHFMDIIAVYPQTSDLSETSIEFRGEYRVENDQKVYDDFRIHIGEGITIAPGDIAELKYIDRMMDEAINSCPDHLVSWAQKIHKIRYVDCVKLSGNGSVTVGVSKHSEHIQKGEDHNLENIKGRVFATYSRSLYESQIMQAGQWQDLSIGARYSDFLRPECNWNEAFASLPENDVNLIVSALLGHDISEIDRAEKILSSRVLATSSIENQSHQFLNIA